MKFQISKQSNRSTIQEEWKFGSVWFFHPLYAMDGGKLLVKSRPWFNIGYCGITFPSLPSQQTDVIDRLGLCLGQQSTFFLTGAVETFPPKEKRSRLNIDNTHTHVCVYVDLSKGAGRTDNWLDPLDIVSATWLLIRELDKVRHQLEINHSGWWNWKHSSLDSAELKIFITHAGKKNLN